jgi:homoserine O-acetyltransferase/O-succinyltransferase
MLELKTQKKQRFLGIDHAETLILQSTKTLHLKHGGLLKNYQVAIETYGKLNADKSNAILICHALNASHHVTGNYAEDDPHPHKQGWWSNMIGRGELGYPIDTDQFFVIGVNNLGSCFGSTGPASINPDTQMPYELDFPSVTIEDWVKVQKQVMHYLGIEQFAAVVGGSMGGMQAFTWSVLYPHSLRNCVVIASTPKLSAQNIAFNEVARQAILSHFASIENQSIDLAVVQQNDSQNEGQNNTQNHQNDVLNKQKNISKDLTTDFVNHRTESKNRSIDGLKLARMIGHITYLSDEDMARKFGRDKQDTKALSKASPNFSMDAEFAVESYLRYQADKFVNYFDPYTYLLCTKALDYFDAAFDFRDLNAACAQSTCQYLMISFTTDWRFPPERTREWVKALIQENKPVAYLEIDAPHGHDAFLMQNEVYHQAMRDYFRNILNARSI